MIDDPTLLRRYAAERSEDAFAELVRRHLPLVYSAAVRRLDGDAHRADDVAQVVFCAVARDARRLSQHAVLTGWLYTATRNAVIDVIRTEQRRRAREEEAHIMQETSSDIETPADWSRLRPVLDAAMDELGREDREAVLLRFFQGRPFAEIGTTLGLSEDTARKRVDRALDKLRGLLGRHKIASTSSALAALLASETISAAPASLAASVTGAALATGGVAVGAVAFMTVTKLQIGIAAALLAGGAIGLVSQQRAIVALRTSNASLQAQLDQRAVENARLTQSNAGLGAEATKLNAAVAALRSPAATTANRWAPNPVATAGRTQPASPLPPVPDTEANRNRRAHYHTEYDPFFAQRGFTAAQIDRLLELFILQDDAREDLQASVRQAGLDGNTPGIEELRSKLYAPIQRELDGIMGDAGVAEYYRYQKDYFFRAGWVDRMQPAFAAGNASLAPPQIDLMVALVADNNRQVRKNPTDIGSEIRVDWESVANKARMFLNPAQQSALQSFISTEKTSEH